MITFTQHPIRGAFITGGGYMSIANLRADINNGLEQGQLIDEYNEDPSQFDLIMDLYLNMETTSHPYISSDILHCTGEAIAYCYGMGRRIYTQQEINNLREALQNVLPIWSQDSTLLRNGAVRNLFVQVLGVQAPLPPP